jgi:large subunit ribosomal protein L17
MRHQKSGYKLNRTASHRKALLRNLVTSLFEHERVTTTEAKAKALRPLADKMITLAKRGDLHARRQVLSVLTKKSVVHKLFAEIGGRYMEVGGGYISLVKGGVRKGDAAPLTIIQLVKPGEAVKQRKKTRKKGAPEKKQAAPQAAAPETTAPKPAAQAAPPLAPDTAPTAPSPSPETGEKNTA